MSNLPFDFTPADRNELLDEVTKLIAQTPQLVGAQINWIEQATESILQGFEEQGLTGIDGLTLREIEDKIQLFVTGESNLFAPRKAAEKVLAKLKDYSTERDQPSGAKDPSVPTDETHEFGIMAKELIDNGSGIDMLQAGPSAVLTEAQALKALAGLKDLVSDVEFVLIARPKPPRWTVLDHQS